MLSGNISRVSLVLGILPIVAINASYLIAAWEGAVPWCVPYWESCTSISAAGREGFAFFFFKATMIPVALLTMWYWILAQAKLADFGYRDTAIPALDIPEQSSLWQLLMCVIILVLGILTLLLDVMLDNYDDYEDGFVWVLALLLHCNFLIGYWSWRNADSSYRTMVGMAPEQTAAT